MRWSPTRRRFSPSVPLSVFTRPAPVSGEAVNRGQNVHGNELRDSADISLGMLGENNPLHTVDFLWPVTCSMVKSRSAVTSSNGIPLLFLSQSFERATARASSSLSDWSSTGTSRIDTVSGSISTSSRRTTACNWRGRVGRASDARVVCPCLFPSADRSLQARRAVRHAAPSRKVSMVRSSVVCYAGGHASISSRRRSTLRQGLFGSAGYRYTRALRRCKRKSHIGERICGPTPSPATAPRGACVDWTPSVLTQCPARRKESA